MEDSMIVAGLGFVVTLIAVLAPVIRLNSNITELTVVVKQLKEIVREKTDKLDERITKHGEEIDDIKLKQTEHETRLTQLEKRQ